MLSLQESHLFLTVLMTCCTSNIHTQVDFTRCQDEVEFDAQWRTCRKLRPIGVILADSESSREKRLEELAELPTTSIELQHSHFYNHNSPLSYVLTTPREPAISYRPSALSAALPQHSNVRPGGERTCLSPNPTRTTISSH